MKLSAMALMVYALTICSLLDLPYALRRAAISFCSGNILGLDTAGFVSFLGGVIGWTWIGGGYCFSFSAGGRDGAFSLFTLSDGYMAK